MRGPNFSQKGEGSMFRLLCVLMALVCSSAAWGEAPATKQSSIVVENRVLATVRDQIITVVDVSKKMDMIFCQQFPQYRGMPEARYEFYRTNWRRIFQELVDRQLILTMAEEKQFSVTNGDIRQELEEMFGPNVMMSLYDEGLSMHDVHEMMRADILLRRAITFYVHSPIIAAVTPAVLKAAYRKRVEELKTRTGWVWRSVSIKSKAGDCPKEIAQKVWGELQKGGKTVEQIGSELGKEVEISLSQTFRSERSDVAPTVQAVLEQLSLRSYSEPQSFTSRSDPRQGWRCYIIDEEFKPEIPSFVELEPQLRQEIASPVIAKRTDEFFEDLRREYHVKHLMTSQELMAFEPFQFVAKAGAA